MADARYRRAVAGGMERENGGRSMSYIEGG
ncbi:hypothetical protein BME24068_03443 [Burkholderia metallica]|nr:hypothetical protein BME24068_03443 [Burkholderia metallica]